MAFDFEAIKKKLSIEAIKEKFSKGSSGKAAKKKTFSSNPRIAKIQHNLEDLQVTFQEGKYSLFVKQFVVLILVFLAVRFLCGKFSQSRAAIKDKIAAINIQRNNKEEYLTNKQRLLRLEPLFPDLAKKNDWLLRQLVESFGLHKMTPTVDGNVVETAGKEFLTVSQPVKFQQTFSRIGRLIADIENGDNFLRISEISITKLNSPDALGENEVVATFNTIFPREKYGPKLFKDYNEQMKKIKAAQEKTTPGKTIQERTTSAVAAKRGGKK
ncbi:MAG: hypothetical protein J6Y17_03075 [Elusimicrobiaceae bacterium]|nr:hypothetical protein [Elusimicrobiaceae bacterium]